MPNPMRRRPRQSWHDAQMSDLDTALAGTRYNKLVNVVVGAAISLLLGMLTVLPNTF